VSDRPNHDAVTEALVRRVRIDDGRCTGVETMVAGLRIAREIGRAGALDPWRGEEVRPGPDVDDDAERAGEAEPLQLFADSARRFVDRRGLGGLSSTDGK
jgi:choline dehydrogenase-like flavoprotein